MEKMFYAILRQSHLRHNEWSLCECGMWTDAVAHKRYSGMVKLLGPRRVMLMVRDGETMRNVNKKLKKEIEI